MSNVSWLRIQSLHSFFSVICQPENAQKVTGRGSGFGCVCGGTIAQKVNDQDRILYPMQYFHGTPAAVKQELRAIALLWNFRPCTRKVYAMEPHSMSPFEDLNGFRYPIIGYAISSRCHSPNWDLNRTDRSW